MLKQLVLLHHSGGRKQSLVGVNKPLEAPLSVLNMRQGWQRTIPERTQVQPWSRWATAAEDDSGVPLLPAQSRKMRLVVNWTLNPPPPPPRLHWSQFSTSSSNVAASHGKSRGPTKRVEILEIDDHRAAGKSTPRQQTSEINRQTNEVEQKK